MQLEVIWREIAWPHASIMQTNIACKIRGFFSRFSSERSGNGARDTRDWGRRRKNNTSFFLRLLASRVSNTPSALDFTRHNKANKNACSAGYNQYRATRRNRGELAPADS